MCCSLDEKIFCHLAAKEYHKVTANNKSHARDFIGREKYRRVFFSAQEKNSRGLSRTQVHIALLGGGRVKFSRVKLSRVGIGGISNPELGLFTLWEESWTQLSGQLQCSVGRPCNWRLSGEESGYLCASRDLQYIHVHQDSTHNSQKIESK